MITQEVKRITLRPETLLNIYQMFRHMDNHQRFIWILMITVA